MNKQSLTFEQWVEERRLSPVPDEPVEVVRQRVAEAHRLAYPDLSARVMLAWPGPPSKYLPAAVREEAPEYFDRLAKGHSDYGNVVVKAPDGSCVIFDAGTPQYYIERRMSARLLHFLDYESWRSYNCHYWPTNAAGQEESRRRTEAMWATNPEPWWSMLHPPFYYSGYLAIDDSERFKDAEYQQRFWGEREVLGDIVIMRTGQRARRNGEGVDYPREVELGTVFAIGTPQRIIDLWAGPLPLDELSEEAFRPTQFLP